MFLILSCPDSSLLCPVQLSLYFVLSFLNAALSCLNPVLSCCCCCCCCQEDRLDGVLGPRGNRIDVSEEVKRKGHQAELTHRMNNEARVSLSSGGLCTES